MSLPEEIIKALEAQGLIIAGRYLNTDDPRDIVEALAPMVEKLHREWYGDGYEEASADAYNRYVLGEGL